KRWSLAYPSIVASGAKVMAGAQFVRSCRSSFVAAVLRMPRRTWRPLYRSTLSVSCASSWDEVRSGSPREARLPRRPHGSKCATATLLLLILNDPPSLARWILSRSHACRGMALPPTHTGRFDAETRDISFHD